MNDCKREQWLVQFEKIFNEKALAKLRAVKGTEEDEEALRKIRWTEKERRDNERQIKEQVQVQG